MRKLFMCGVVVFLALALGAGNEWRVRDAGASSHREAPLISQDPAVDNTDVYMFRSPEDPTTVTLIANFYPYQVPSGGPNFYRFADDARYEFNIDNNGDAKSDVRYFLRFNTRILKNDTFLYNVGPLTNLDDPNLTVQQRYTVWKKEGKTLTVLLTGAIVPPSNVGCHSFATNGQLGQIPAQPCSQNNGVENYRALAQTAVYPLANGEGKVFAGQRRDSFFADVGAIFDLLSIRGSFDSGGRDVFGDYNVQTIALQIPISKLATADDPVIGFWASASRKATRVLPKTENADANDAKILSRTWKQVSRLGLPLINEVIIPMALKNKYNGTKPKNDAINFSAPILDPELAGLLKTLYGISVPAAPRQDLVDALLLGIPGLNRPSKYSVPADILRLNTSTPVCASNCSTFGVIGGDAQGYPNGRRLTDDVVDISERVIAGVLVNGYNVAPNNALGDGVNAPPYAFDDAFPYLAAPIDGFSYGN